MSKPNIGELVFFWILFAVVGLLAFTIMSPYFAPLFLAAVLAISFSTVHVRILTFVRGQETLAALLTTLLVLCLILLPLVYFGVLMLQEAIATYDAITAGNGVYGVTDQFIQGLVAKIRIIAPSFEMQSNATVYLESFLRWIVVNLQGFFSGILVFLFDLIIVIIALFFFCRDGARLKDFAVKWSPLSDNYDASILLKLELGVHSVVKGSLLTAVMQGTLVGIGFAIFGIPNPVLWGVVAVVAALIPTVGTGLITFPAAAFLLFDQQVFGGVGLIIWGVLVGISDNIARPILMSREIDMHPFLVLLSVLGGLVYFGPIGFLAGPIVLVFFFALLQIYPAIVKGNRINGE
jgi:predicted PurR-regulated permease PerM